MGEKEVLEDDGSSGSTGGTNGPDAGGGQSHTPGPTDGGIPQTQERTDPCKELKDRATTLLGQLEGLHDQNREQTQRALRAFFGDPADPQAGGYAHWFTQSKVTEAVVDANNATGKVLIDTALFAMGGWGGLKVFGAPAGFVSKADKLFGSGLRGAESVAGAYGKIFLKITEKVADEYVGRKAGKTGSTLYKTIDKIESATHGRAFEPSKWYQPSLGMLESVVRGSILDALADWAKTGAMAGDLGRATSAYADFFAAAMAANVSAAGAEQIHAQLQDLNAEARAKHCPETAIPDYLFYSFEPTQFGAGAFIGQAGPTMHSHAIESGVDRDWDLFANIADTSGLPF